MLATTFCRILQSEDGAVTVDWVVMAAVVVSLGVAIVALIQDGATDVSSGIGAKLSSASVYTIKF
ncbi:hypothetical protein Rumeso_00575 [Rubellimicrobium mesophilum DSM 19309]|uniref:Flp pilus assembly protein, pilin Flp n=1 Tax=Rubellimicrobium mesophilum DSM 19309 TaxID=442562 RepID=A0A017HUK5_9RHOB|nr:hypothetical protein [Rubellimicrobium mesophilum]EYD77848.1 hypothetical protein Rumeso_00575 [Rubellimicrobium mesophilum DSM 19309]